MLELGYLTKEFQKTPDIYFLFGSENSKDVEAFFEITDTRFPYMQISTEDMFALIGEQTPRFYRLVAGEIQAYWDSDIITHLEERFRQINKPEDR